MDMAGAWLPSASRLQFFSSRCTLAACAAFAIKRKKKVPNVQWLQDRADLRMELEEQIVSTVQPSLAIPTIHTYRMKTPVHSQPQRLNHSSYTSVSDSSTSPSIRPPNQPACGISTQQEFPQRQQRRSCATLNAPRLRDINNLHDNSQGPRKKAVDIGEKLFCFGSYLPVKTALALAPSCSCSCSPIYLSRHANPLSPPSLPCHGKSTLTPLLEWCESDRTVLHGIDRRCRCR